jgi:large conductance mechanosensitive channel
MLNFKDFVIKRNVIHLAVAVVIGAAFGAVVTSMVSRAVMPPIGMLRGHIGFNGQTYPTFASAQTAAAPVVANGQFFNTVNFLIVALVIFLAVRAASRLQEPAAPPPPAPAATKDCHFCFQTISHRASRCPCCTSPLA